MALTDHCDVFGSLSETFLSDLVKNASRQRPSLFNYGTESFVAAPQLMCQEIEVASGLPGNQPLVTFENPIPVPGTDGAWAFEYCAQLTDLEIDFHPGNRFQIPAELTPPLAEQSLALRARFCVGLACPSRELLAKLGYIESGKYPSLDPKAAFASKDSDRPKPTPRHPPKTLPVDREKIHCFCLEVFVTAKLATTITLAGPALYVQLTGLEIVDIKPDGLETILECLLTATLSLGVLPRFRLSIADIVLGLAEYGTLTIGLTPTSANVPFNPSIAQDRLSVFINVDLN